MLKYGPGLAFAVNVFGYAFYLGTLALLRTPKEYRPPALSGRSMVGDFIDGMRYISADKNVCVLLFLLLVGDALSSAVYQMLPAYVDETLRMGVGGVSILLAASGVGATLSALWLAYGGVGSVTPSRVLWAFSAFVVSVGCLTISETLLLGVLAMAAFGASSEIRRTGTVSILQLAVTDEQRGRIMSAQYLLQCVANAIGVYLIGASAAYYGLRLPLLIAVAIAALACIVGVGIRRL